MGNTHLGVRWLLPLISLGLMFYHAKFGCSGAMSPQVELLTENFTPFTDVEALTFWE